MPAILGDCPEPCLESLEDESGPEAQGDEGVRIKTHRMEASNESFRPISIQATHPLDGVRRAIEASQRILELGDDWDECGASSVAPETWSRAIEFLYCHAYVLWQTHRKKITPPDIAPGPKGSIDLHWDLPEFELLINIRPDPKEMAGCYGDDRGKIKIKATFDPGTINEGLLLWLMKTNA